MAKCKTRGCRGEAYVSADGYQRAKCLKCQARKWKESRPFSYHFNALRNNARRRGKAFELTIEEYTQFAIDNGLILPDGTKAPNLSIDRIDPSQGYRIGNIQVLSLGDNSRKRYVDYYRQNMHQVDAEQQAKWQAYIDANTQQPEPEEELPFNN